MGNLKDKLKSEEKTLEEKIQKLYDFIQSEAFPDASDTQRPLLLIQLEAMRAYWRCVVARINDLDNL